jgi:galactose mutarotase-like enzyme
MLMTTLDLFNRVPRITLNNGVISASFLPHTGGKMVSLRRNESGQEFLLPPSSGECQRGSYGAIFGSADASGFDECVPTVSPCRDPNTPLSRETLPDHGDLWSSAWEYQLEADSLVLKARGKCLPYEFTKRITLQESQIILQYEICNSGPSPVKYLWSSHPLLIAEPGAYVILPDDVENVFVNWSRDSQLGTLGDCIPWPGVQKLDMIGDPSSRTAHKLYATNLRKGYCAFYRPRANESILFRFDPAEIPHLGVWICEGGWPEEGGGSQFTVALEPCKGYPDSLEEAARRGTCSELPPGATQRWSLRLELQKGRPRVE